MIINGKWKLINLGTSRIFQKVLLEYKKLGSILLHYWDKGEQDRWHTHAFSSIAITLRGGYSEEYLTEGGDIVRRECVAPKVRYWPRQSAHRILDALPGTVSIVLTLPWSREWHEYHLETKLFTTYTWGRKVLRREPTPPIPSLAPLIGRGIGDTKGPI